MPSRDYMTTAEAAKEWGRSVYTIQQYCRFGQIRARQFCKGGRYLIDRDQKPPILDNRPAFTVPHDVDRDEELTPEEKRWWGMQ